MPNMPTISQQLRQAIKSCGVTRYAINRATGVPHSVLSRFVASGNGLRSENLDKLCTYLGLTLQQTGKPPTPMAQDPNAARRGRPPKQSTTKKTPKPKSITPQPKNTQSTTKAGPARKGK